MKNILHLLVALLAAAGSATAQQVRFVASTTVAIHTAADRYVFTGKPIATVRVSLGQSS